ncbi:hypothetical protein [Halalkalibacter krulwichiae]|uniref:Uncharacterized protein n=1 Tax=Halalkalibacter krulwichiae TaxID=199441 RepID=A0A1X9MG20_9BACI|nr:hypothetical protein [Halalkalibacter krulwichiae]ARK32366.1 hypothetical protein BkAM31D_22290 [Halalkalibacter krulwichiae]
MRNIYRITIHAIHLLSLVIIGFVTVGMFSNPSDGAGSPFNPVNIGVVIFLLIILFATYYFQLKKNNWKIVLIGSFLFIAVFLVVMLLIYPYVYSF